MPTFLPITAIVVTKNEESNISRCLKTLNGFSDVIVVDSASTDKTAQHVRQFPNIRLEHFIWDGQYPKKRQWCLDNLATKHDWILFIDADEAMTFALQQELAALDLENDKTYAGFFIRGQYVYDGQALKFGLKNNKCMLIHKNHMHFPPVDDLDIEGMGEIEGHYQPIKREGAQNLKIGQLKNTILHYAYEDQAAWESRHKKYAAWQRKVNERGALPADVSAGRKRLKALFSALPCKGIAAFLHCYILKAGFLDGRAGYHFACSRKYYYDLIYSPIHPDALGVDKAKAIGVE